MAKAKSRNSGELLADAARRKIDPKLRMISNGNDDVNTVRAEYASCISVSSLKLLGSARAYRTDSKAILPIVATSTRLPRGRQTRLSGNISASVFIRTQRRSSPNDKLDFRVTGRLGNLATAEVPLAELPAVAGRDYVRHVEAGESVRDPSPIISEVVPKPPMKKRFGLENKHRYGAGILIGIIDVGGFDFSHPDFLASSKSTRWVAIWDQGGTHRPPPEGAGYGSELTKAHMDRALADSAQARVRPTDLEPQSQMSPGSHGTHVASIAAGNTGVCSKAKIAGVLVSLPPEEVADRRRFILDSTRLAHAVDYLVKVAEREKCAAVSINISLGTNGGAHDGTSGICRWIDSILMEPGRCVCVAAGNAGQEIGQTEDDLGWMMGRIHTSGCIEARGLSVDIEWQVLGDSVADISENELEIWYSPQDRFSVEIRPPGSSTWIKPVLPRQFIENMQLQSRSFLSVYNDLFHPVNGANCISVYLSPYLRGDKGIVGVPAGIWTVRLTGLEVKNGRFDAWIERDDPRPVRRWGDREEWNLPSCFTVRSNVDRSSVSSLACARYAVAVANVDPARSRVHISSSQGPTRDNREKPEIAAPGTDVVAAKGFAGDEDLWIAMTGTSMASPYVCGVAGLMLACNHELTSSQIQGMLARTASPLPGDTHRWNDRAGFGPINPDACISEAVMFKTRTDITGG